MNADALPATPVVPTHLAVIMDGNGRWAAARGWPRIRGHEEGAKAVSKIVRRWSWACERSRSTARQRTGTVEDEVDGLMGPSRRT